MTNEWVQMQLIEVETPGRKIQLLRRKVNSSLETMKLNYQWIVYMVINVEQVKILISSEERDFSLK